MNNYNMLNIVKQENIKNRDFKNKPPPLSIWEIDG